MGEIKQCSVCKAKPAEWAMSPRKGICWTCGAAAARWIQRHQDHLQPLWSATAPVVKPYEDIPVPDHHGKVEAMVRAQYQPATQVNRALDAVQMAEWELRNEMPHSALCSAAESIEKMLPSTREAMPRAVAVLFSKKAGWCGDVERLRHALYPN